MDNTVELINKAEVKEFFRPKNSQDFSAAIKYNEICRALDGMKVYSPMEIDKQESVNLGTWQSSGHLGEDYKCSECGRTSEFTTAYCPHCGAKMDKQKTQRSRRK